ILSTVSGNSVSIASLGLDEGRQLVQVRRVEGDLKSEPATITLNVGASDTETATIEPTSLLAVATAAGGVAVSWISVDRTGLLTRPAEFEVAEASDLATILATVAGGVGVRSTELSGFTDGQAVQLAVRSSDGLVSGSRGDWIYANAVGADSSGPATPTPYAGSSGGS
ncbi:MAG: hypothetical protein AAFQ17_05435, partial [Pseudomonadota bacterium]